MTYNKSLQKQVFSGNWLHWYWQPNDNQEQYVHENKK